MYSPWNFKLLWSMKLIKKNCPQFILNIDIERYAINLFTPTAFYNTHFTEDMQICFIKLEVIEQKITISKR